VGRPQRPKLHRACRQHRQQSLKNLYGRGRIAEAVHEERVRAVAGVEFLCARPTVFGQCVPLTVRLLEPSGPALIRQSSPIAVVDEVTVARRAGIGGKQDGRRRAQTFVPRDTMRSREVFRPLRQLNPKLRGPVRHGRPQGRRRSLTHTT